MIAEIILKEFVAAIFKNSILKKYTDPLLKKGVERLKSIFQKKNKEHLLAELATSPDTAKQLAEKHSQDFDELLGDPEFRQTVTQLASSPSVYASVVNVSLDAAQDISIKLKNASGQTADINCSIVNSTIKSTTGKIDIDITG